MRAALTEWVTGQRQKIKGFAEDDYKKYYNAYLADLTTWDSMNPVVSSKIRRRMFEKAR